MGSSCSQHDTRLSVIPIARAEFTIAPLLQVPPASRGEPRTGSVPPARRGNLKEGVFNRACFCKLCPRDWYNTHHASPRGQGLLESVQRQRERVAFALPNPTAAHAAGTDRRHPQSAARHFSCVASLIGSAAASVMATTQSQFAWASQFSVPVIVKLQCATKVRTEVRVPSHAHTRAEVVSAGTRHTRARWNGRTSARYTRVDCPTRLDNRA
jgi:hypothetical protein